MDGGAQSEVAKRIRQLRADALLGKKKHYNAADRKQRYQSRIGIAVIAINLFLASALISLLRETIQDQVKWVGAGLAFAAALLAASQSFFGFQKAIQGHRSIAGRYLDVVKQCSNCLASYADGAITDSQLGKKLDGLTAAMTKVDSDAHGFPTNDDDFQLARCGLTDGEEQYTDADLRAGD
jgi:hypothetical protein